MQEFFLDFGQKTPPPPPLGHPALLISNGSFLTKVAPLHKGYLGNRRVAVVRQGYFARTPNDSEFSD